MTPKINKQAGMNFYDALRQLREGAYITRMSWNNSDFCLLKDTFLSIYRTGEVYKWTVNDGDMDGTDWIVTINKKTNV